MSAGAGRIQFLSWDSRFFKRRIAYVQGDRLTRSIWYRIQTQCRRQQIDCLYFLGRSDDPATLRMAEEAGFGLMDIRVTLKKDLAGFAPSPAPSFTTFVLARRTDIPELQKIASGLYKGSRFAIDPDFPKEAAPRLFAEWMSRAVAGRYDDCVWMARLGGRLAGFISYRMAKDHTGAIGLVGVAPRVQGHGVGGALIQHSLEWFREKGAGSIAVVTQGRNVAAQRLYQKFGFRTEKVELWYHKWFQR